MDSKNKKGCEAYHEKCHMLYDLLYRYRDIQQIIEEASSIIGNSLILADNSYNVLANTTIDCPEDELWQFISAHGYYPQNYIEDLINHGQSGLFVSTDLGIMQDEGYTARYYSRKIYANDKNIGFITLVEHKRPLTEDDALILNELAHVLKVALERARARNEKHEDKLGYVITELLTTKPDESRLNSRLTYAGLKPLPYMNVIIMEKQSFDKDLSVEYMIKATRQYIAGSKGVPLGENRAGFIAMRHSLTEDIFVDKEAALDFFKRRNIKIGVSYTYKNIGNTYYHVNEADKAISVGRRIQSDDIVYDYERFCVMVAVDEHVNESARTGLVNPKLGMIRDYDRVHGTDYYNTLKCYMECDLNKGKTAKKMNIHRNTVEYRITRLTETYGIDPSDGELAMSYRLSFFLFDGK